MSKETSVLIYTYFYRQGQLVAQDPIYQPVIAGKKLLKTHSSMMGDDTGDNISDKNKQYSELTGIYWVWKNTTQNIIGCCHYRRFFTAMPVPFFYELRYSYYWLAGLYKKRHGLIYTANTKFFASRILNKKQVLDIFNTYDAILPQSRKLKYSVEAHYCRYHNGNDLKILAAIIDKYYPDYKDAFSAVLKQKRMYANNMFILPQNLYERFIEWWFGVLFKFEKHIEVDNYVGYQERVLGFAAERLLNVWFSHANLKIKELPVIYFKKLKQD